MISKEKVKELLPQKDPFRFIDSVDEIEVVNRMIRCSYTFNPDNPIFKGHFPSSPIVPGVLLIESAAQSSILLIQHMHGNAQIGEGRNLLSKIEEVKFKESLLPNQEATIITKLERSISTFHFFSSKVYHQEHEILAGKFIVFKSL